MTDSGIQHVIFGDIPIPQADFEDQAFHALVHGTTFPASPVERQLYYRDDTHKWYIYNGTAWKECTGGDADIATHAALTTGVHGVGAKHVAAFHSAGQEVSKVVWKDTSAQALSDADRTTSLDWTDLDLTAHTSANAKCAILVIHFHIDSITAGSGNYFDFRVRKNGTTGGAYPPQIIVDGVDTAANSYRRYFLICGLDTGQVLEYKLSVVGTLQIDTAINVLGYIE